VTGLLSLVLLVAGALVMYAAWRRDPAGDPVAGLGRAGALLASGFRVDDFYDRIAVRPVWALAQLVRRTDHDVIDAYVRGAGLGSRFAGGLLRRTQNGNISTYLTMLLFGVALIAISAVAVLG
jgi:NADH-quinone oxidoreductase subunit L